MISPALVSVAAIAQLSAPPGKSSMPCRARVGAGVGSGVAAGVGDVVGVGLLGVGVLTGPVGLGEVVGIGWAQAAAISAAATSPAILTGRMLPESVRYRITRQSPPGSSPRPSAS